MEWKNVVLKGGGEEGVDGIISCVTKDNRQTDASVLYCM